MTDFATVKEAALNATKDIPEPSRPELDYIRVGCDYYRVMKDHDRWGTEQTIIQPWKKEEIKLDHDKEILRRIPKHLKFTIHPENKKHIPVINSCYNLYSPFPHKPTSIDAFDSDKLLPTTTKLLTHVFGEQIKIGLEYMKVLYDDPSQMLPILCLVSQERETGKTTFLNWIQQLFGYNCVLLNPHEFLDRFNSGYASKNLVLVDESVIEKSPIVEKLKSLATAKNISVSQKFVAQYTIPFYGKFIMCTNKEDDFIKIEEDEIRFWVRRITTVPGEKNLNIEKDLWNEIPYFLQYLNSMPKVIYRSRMVFTKKELFTDQLFSVVQQGKNGIQKEIEFRLQDLFNEKQLDSFDATAIDIKEKFFANNHSVSATYVFRVITKEMKLIPGPNRWYDRFGEENRKRGIAFRFIADKSIFYWDK